jgi:MraZ protein
MLPCEFHSPIEWEKVGESGLKAMSMFRGAQKVTLDVKGRVVLPTRVREVLASRGENRVVATVDREQHLLIYPLPDWDALQEQLLGLPNLNEEARWLQRFMVGYATDLDIDSHGRVLLSAELREFAGLERDAMLFGQGNHLELWDEQRWKAASAEALKASRRSSVPAQQLDSLRLSAGTRGASPQDPDR